MKDSRLGYVVFYNQPLGKYPSHAAITHTRFNGDRSIDLHFPPRQGLSGLHAVVCNRLVGPGRICVVPGNHTAGGQFRGEHQSWFQPAVADLFRQWLAGRHFGSPVRTLCVA